MAWFPGAIRDPGLNASYRRGRSSMQLAVCHFTVGRDSRALIRNSGLAAFLFPKVGPPIQFCEADAITSHACEWNSKGPGLELERMNWDEPFTADQSRWVGEVCRWLSATYGIPLAHHHVASGRLPIGSGFRGFADHGGLVHRACDQHTDGWTDQEWAGAIGQPSSSTGDDDMPKRLLIHAPNSYAIYQTDFTREGTDGPLSGPMLDHLRTPIAAALFLVSPDISEQPQAVVDYLTAPSTSFARLFAWLAKLWPVKAGRAGAP